MAPLTSGIILCIFGSSAFTAMGIILGLAAVIAGGYFLFCFFAMRRVLLIQAIALIAIGLLLIILCIFVKAMASFLGGIIMAAAGIILLPACNHHHRLVLPFCAACLVLGIIMFFATAIIAWITVFVGILLIIYSGLVLMFTY